MDVGIYLHYRRARVVLGDMYELVRSVKVRLHSFIKRIEEELARNVIAMKTGPENRAA